MKNLRTERVKDAINKKIGKNSFCKEHLARRSVNLGFWYQEHYGVVVDITNIKCRFFSKQLFQRTQQHGGCTKHLRNDKFV